MGTKFEDVHHEDMMSKIAVDSVIFREDLYPRIDKSATTVQKYAEDLTVLPPIIINQHNELIDGWHRWTAHKKNEVAEIEATVIETKSDAHLLELAIEKNATHGLQLSQSDKKKMAVRIYISTPEKERDEKKKQLEKILSVSERSVQAWLSDIDKQAREERNKEIFDMWMACYNQIEIAKLAGVEQPLVSATIKKRKDADFYNCAANKAKGEYADESFEAPLYNVWRFHKNSHDVKHFGNSEVRIVDNLLYLYTKPFDIVVDPFAGSGSTIAICKRRFRRYWVSDRKPIPEMDGKIRQMDLNDDMPSFSDWKDVRLVYLDPPYWKQAEGKYSQDANDLANMPIEQFNETLSGIINRFSEKLRNSRNKTEPAYIALIIQPTQWNAPNKEFTDHVGDMLRAINLPVHMRYQAPYETQQCTPQMVEWAKENRTTLVLSREIVVWKVA